MSPDTEPAFHPGLVREPDCACCGRPVWRAATCACGHSYALHDLNRRGQRTECLHMEQAGPCGCRTFEEAPHGSA